MNRTLPLQAFLTLAVLLTIPQAYPLLAQDKPLILTGELGVFSVAFSPDGKRIATASAAGSASVWDVQSGKILHILEGNTGHVYILGFNVAFSPDGKRIVTASIDETTRVWDAESGQELRKLVGHTDYVRGVAFSPDGKRIVTTSGDKTARVWDAE